MGSRTLRRAAALAAALSVTLAGLALADVIQREGLRITVRSQILPYKLPRTGTAPIAVFIAGALSEPKGGIPPQLSQLTVRVNRHGLLQSRGLPACGVAQIQPSSTDRALRVCREALIGSGRFWAHIVLPGQRPYPTQGRLLVFNSRQRGKPALLAHIYSKDPFNASFTIAFEITKISKGPYGTQLRASFPRALGDWGYVDRIKLTLRRKYTHRGRHLSYFNAGCPAPRGAKRTNYPLARVSFDFTDRDSVATTVSKACGVKE